jgi:hypothetical protein
MAYAGMVDLTDYGAAIDGVTDDAAALAAAIAAVSTSGGQVWIPPGTVQVASTITVPEHVVLRGAARRSSLIRGSVAGPIVAVTATEHGGLIDLGIRQQSTHADAIGVSVTGTSYMTQILRCNVIGTSVGTGVLLSAGCYYATVADCRVADWGRGVTVERSGGLGSNACVIRGTLVTGAVETGIRIDQVSDTTIRDCSIEESPYTVAGIHVVAGSEWTTRCVGTLIDHVRLGDNTGCTGEAAIVLEGAQNVTISATRIGEDAAKAIAFTSGARWNRASIIMSARRTDPIVWSGGASDNYVEGFVRDGSDSYVIEADAHKWNAVRNLDRLEQH